MTNFFLLLSIVIPAALLIAAVINSYREGEPRGLSGQRKWR